MFYFIQVSPTPWICWKCNWKHSRRENFHCLKCLQKSTNPTDSGGIFFPIFFQNSLQDFTMAFLRHCSVNWPTRPLALPFMRRRRSKYQGMSVSSRRWRWLALQVRMWKSPQSANGIKLKVRVAVLLDPLLIWSMSGCRMTLSCLRPNAETTRMRLMDCYEWAEWEENENLNPINSIVQVEGVRKLFNGCTMATGRAVLMTIGQLSFYDQIKQAFKFINFLNLIPADVDCGKFGRWQHLHPSVFLFPCRFRSNCSHPTNGCQNHTHFAETFKYTI